MDKSACKPACAPAVIATWAGSRVNPRQRIQSRTASQPRCSCSRGRIGEGLVCALRENRAQGLGDDGIIDSRWRDARHVDPRGHGHRLREQARGTALRHDECATPDLAGDQPFLRRLFEGARHGGEIDPRACGPARAGPAGAYWPAIPPFRSPMRSARTIATVLEIPSSSLGPTLLSLQHCFAYIISIDSYNATRKCREGRDIEKLSWCGNGSSTNRQGGNASGCAFAISRLIRYGRSTSPYGRELPHEQGAACIDAAMDGIVSRCK